MTPRAVTCQPRERGIPTPIPTALLLTVRLSCGDHSKYSLSLQLHYQDRGSLKPVHRRWTDGVAGWRDPSSGPIIVAVLLCRSQHARRCSSEHPQSTWYVAGAFANSPAETGSVAGPRFARRAPRSSRRGPRPPTAWSRASARTARSAAGSASTSKASAWCRSRATPTRRSRAAASARRDRRASSWSTTRAG